MVTGENITNVTITGKGTFDGMGHQWWADSVPHPMRPQLVGFYNASDVRLFDFLLRDAGRMHLDMYGSRFRVHGLTVRSANVISTDGLDVGVTDAHISNVDVMNGDDCIVMKRTARNVLVENSYVSQGHGLVMGTSGGVDMHNITFRNIVVNNTMDGIWIKFKDNQHGSVSDILFENITIINAQRYAVGIDTQIIQGWPPVHDPNCTRCTRIPITNVTFRHVTASSQQFAGTFYCKPQYPCKQIQFDDVHITAPKGCFFNNTFGSSSEVSPASCSPPAAE